MNERPQDQIEYAAKVMLAQAKVPLSENDLKALQALQNLPFRDLIVATIRHDRAIIAALMGRR